MDELDILPEINDLLVPLDNDIGLTKKERKERLAKQQQRQQDQREQDRRQTIEELAQSRVACGLVAAEKHIHKFTCKLYDLINSYLLDPLPYDSKIIFWSDQMRYLGVTIGCMDYDHVDSIVLNTCLSSNKQSIFDTLVHEIIHALNIIHEKEPSAPHGPVFKKQGRIVISLLKSNKRTLKSLFGGRLNIDGNRILPAKISCP